ncbi:helix-turn-helix domain-containing protein [Caballeronia sp. SEWSISQ10-4 2]|uniref:helix-turn-helix domain-containing protein n=1 Tax=Caballeronia sp. SEWSISQ10-4 2 TaxID=2937438 RepID=UPI00264BCD63|nr:helix-turn-helix transcriptional regulator [Caballeronia sp. SEWSISQ10-4 2]MDN7184679.1 helix-turn-helix domain-containing protein [Caballeronia sp. SEWSISQ10-4 2]
MKLNQTDFATLGGVQKQAQFQYEKGMRRPNSDYLAAISAGGVDVLYLLTGQPSTVTLSVDEGALIAGYRGLNARERAGVRALVDTIVVTPRRKENTDEQ